jgi:hypothetical protein
MPNNARPPRGAAKPEALPYRVELWQADGRDAMDRVLGRAVNAQLAHAIFKAAKDEHPERRVILREGNRIIADSSRE